MHLKKKYNHIAVEAELFKKKYFQKIYTHKKNTKRDMVITQLPINISKETSLESINDLIKESVIATYQIMKGNKVKLLPIFDTDQKNLTITNYENILKKVWIFSEIDIDNLVYSERNTNFVRNLFVELVEEGHIYEDYSINYRSVNEQKTLSNDELERKTTTSKEYHIRYFVDTKNISLIVPTLRPETIFADVALAVNPEDKRYKKIIGQKVIIPIINRTIPIIADESIEYTKGTWIIRITPAHDKQSLEIAKKNNLNIDTYAIDKKWYFTSCAKDFCSKEAKEFVKNIIKNLDDIHNLESVHTIPNKVAIHKKTGEKARPLLCNQLFIKRKDENEHIQKAIYKEEFSIHPKKNKEKIATHINNIGTRPVTKEDSKGYALPLRTSKKGKNYFISDNNFLNLPISKTKNKYTVLSLIIFNLIVDGSLRQHFSIEECIDTILWPSRTGKKNVLETYIELFQETLPRGYSKEFKELEKIIEYTQQNIIHTKGKWVQIFEKCSLILTTMLEKSIAITSKKKWFYSFNIDMLTNDEWLTQHKEKIEETIGNGLILIKMMEAFNEKKQTTKKILYTKEDAILNVFKTIITGYNVQEKLLFDEIYIQHTENKKTKWTLQETIKKRWIDCTRLYSINPQTDIQDNEKFINKLRNASRFVIQHIETKKNISFDGITQYIKKNIPHLTEFELRIIYKITELQKDYEDMLNQNTLNQLIEKIINVITIDFCDKYLEIQKHQESKHKDQVIVRCLWNILKFLHPFVPFVSQYIRDMIWYNGAIIEHHTPNPIQDIQKNYKTQLFIDIIDKFLSLRRQRGYAKHETVEICFLAPLDFLQYLREQEYIVKKLIHTSDIKYLNNEKDLETYTTETIINITIGIKTQRKEVPISKKESLQDVLKTKEQELQSIRILIPSLSANWADPEIIRKKKKEMNKLKQEIEEIQYEIQKEKAK